MTDAIYVDLGPTDYLETLNLQKTLATMRHEDKIPDTVLLTEHYPAILFGRDTAKNAFSDEFLAHLNGKDPAKQLAELGIRLYKDMPYGGGGSYIGPGQLVVYPINDYTRLLKPLDLAGYKNLIDRVMLDVMSDFGIDAYIAQGTITTHQGQRDRRDVWYDIAGKSHKIAAKGIHLAGRIAYHGFQIYVTKDGLRYFDFVKPCGYDRNEVWVMSMEDVMGKKPSMEEVKSSVLRSIQQHFDYRHIERSATIPSES